MSKTIVIVGFGPGTATAVAEKFGAEGFSVALVGRNEERLAAGVSSLNGRGVKAFGFKGDATDSASIRAAIKSVRSQLGPITVLHWNAYGLEAGDLLAAEPEALRRDLDAAVFGLLAATEEVRDDLKGRDDGAILISNGGLGDVSPQEDRAATSSNTMGLALASAAKHKLAGLLAERLRGEGIYVGEVMTFSTIRRTPGEVPANSVDPTRIADTFWDLYRARNEVRAAIRT